MPVDNGSLYQPRRQPSKRSLAKVNGGCGGNGRDLLDDCGLGTFSKKEEILV